MTDMSDHQIIDSSFTATINAPIDKIDIPAWCFGLGKRIPGLFTGPHRGRLYDGAGRPADVDQR
jgi:hypothetical protein